MDLNFNKLPPGFSLPAEFEGCKPLDVEQASIEDGQTEQAWMVTCKAPDRSIVRKKIPKSAMVDEKKEADKARAAAAEIATLEAPAAGEEGQ